MSTLLLLPEGDFVLLVFRSLLSTAGACSAAAPLLLNKRSAARLCVGRAGPLLLIIFAVITWHYSVMLVDAYRYPTVDGPTRNYTYIEAVDRYLGAKTWAVLPPKAHPSPDVAMLCHAHTRAHPYPHVACKCNIGLQLCSG